MKSTREYELVGLRNFKPKVECNLLDNHEWQCRGHGAGNKGMFIENVNIISAGGSAQMTIGTSPEAITIEQYGENASNSFSCKSSKDYKIKKLGCF